MDKYWFPKAMSPRSDDIGVVKGLKEQLPGAVLIHLDSLKSLG
ncbi:hypothetical protein OK016_27470 [Vibrio chagasii]|nr:hypothetical protein [Vibrio chagasii]